MFSITIIVLDYSTLSFKTFRIDCLERQKIFIANLPRHDYILINELLKNYKLNSHILNILNLLREAVYSKCTNCQVVATL